MGAPKTLPANFFEGKTGQAGPPKTLPANFDFKAGAASTATPQKTEPIDPTRGAAQATGLRPPAPFNLEQYLNSPEAKKIKSDMENTAMGSAGLGGMVKGAQALFKPTMSTVPEISKLLGPTGKPLIRMVEQEGPSAAQKAGQAVVKSIKAVPAWMKANPVKAAGIGIVAHEMGVDPIQLAHKLLKYGGGLVP